MKKIIAIILTVLITAALCACSGQDPASGNPSSGGNNKTEKNGTSSPAASEKPGQTPDFSALNIRLADWKNVEWTDYSNVYFTLRIPKGWQVEWQGNAQQLYWRAYDPDSMLGLSNLDHRYAAKDYIYMQAGAVDMYRVNGTVREFF